MNRLFLARHARSRSNACLLFKQRQKSSKCIRRCFVQIPSIFLHNTLIRPNNNSFKLNKTIFTISFLSWTKKVYFREQTDCFATKNNVSSINTGKASSTSSAVMRTKPATFVYCHNKTQWRAHKYFWVGSNIFGTTYFFIMKVTNLTATMIWVNPRK